MSSNKLVQITASRCEIIIWELINDILKPNSLLNTAATMIRSWKSYIVMIAIDLKSGSD